MTKKCLKCKGCSKFSSTWSCSCLLKYGDHRTVIETREERIAAGKPVSEIENIINDGLMNGMANNNNQMNNFMDLVDGSDKFSAQIEEMERFRNEQQALGYQPKNQLKNGPPSEESYGEIGYGDSLDNLNVKMDRDNKMNQMMVPGSKKSIGNDQQVAKNYQGNHGVGLYDQKNSYELYCTPHQYSKISAPMKRIGY